MKRKHKKVAYILSQYPNLSQTFVSREIDAIRNLGVEIDIFSLKRVKSREPLVFYTNFISIIHANILYLFKNPFLYGFLILRVLSGFVSYNFKSVFKNLYIFFESVYFSKLISTRGIGHIHAHFLWAAGTSAWIISQMLKIPFSITVHAFDIFDKNRIDNLFRHKLQCASFIVAISDYNKRLLIEKYNIEEAKIHVIHCGIEKRILSEIDERKFENEVPLIVSVGRLTPKKGFKYLIESLRLLSERGIEFRAEIVGDGEDKDTLQRLTNLSGLSDKIFFRGEMANKDTLSLIRKADMFVLPSIITKSGDMDGIPVVLMEAMALGIPVVSTNISGIPELIENGINGLLVPEKDIPALADAIESLIIDKKRRFEIGRTGKGKIRHSFIIEDNAYRLAELFNKTMLQLDT